MGAIGSIGANAGSNVAYTWAGKPAAAGNSGATIRITDVGGAGGSLWTSNGTDWFPVGGVVVLACSGTAVANTGNTSENTVYTLPVPAGMLGANGALHVTPLFDYTNNANTKTMKCKFDGTLVYSVATTTTTSLQMQYVVRNANAANAQIAQASSGSTGMGAVASSLLTGSSNTANAVNFTITAQCANAADTITLRGVLAVLYKQ